MGLRGFGIFLLRFLISMFLFSLIFLTITDLNVKSTLGYLFLDIYDYADIGAQNDAMSNLEKVCVGLNEGETPLFVQLKDICSNSDKFEEASQKCEEYKQLKSSGQIKIDTDIEQNCQLITSPEIDRMCSQVNNTLYFGTENANVICNLWQSGEISDKEFFRDFILSNTDIPNIYVFNSKKLVIPIIIITAFLVGLLFILYKEDFASLAYDLGRVFLSIGILFLIIYGAFWAYRHYIGLDTSDILRLVTGTARSDNLMDSFSVLIPIILSRVFNSKYLIVGGCMFVLGIILKLASRRYMQKDKK